MPFLSLDNNWSNLAPLYNQNFNGKPTVPRKIEQFTSFDDGLIRGGVFNSTLATVKDVVRIGKFYITGKGASFLLKQVGLQLSNPQLETKYNSPTTNTSNQTQAGALISRVTDYVKTNPTKVYNLGINTLAQVGVQAAGLHIVRHGLLPKFESDYNYEKVATENNIAQGPRMSVIPAQKFLTNDDTGTLQTGNSNRLVNYLSILNLDSSGPIALQSYTGGPSSVYGLTKTVIRTTNVRTTINDNDLAFKTVGNNVSTNIFGVSPFGNVPVLTTITNAFQSSINAPANPTLSLRLNGFVPLTNAQIQEAEKADLKSPLKSQLEKSPFSGSRSQASNNIESRIGVSHGGALKKVDSINSINITDSNTFYNTLKNKLNSEVQNNNVFNSDIQTQLDGTFSKDIIKFRIEFLNNDEPILSTDTNKIANTDVLAFRAYIDDFNDGMNARWNAYRYMGRGEEFYVYDGFTRDINVTFTIFSHTKEEMKPLYQKLNYLMSTFAPDYNRANKMRGNIGYLTIGDYLYRVPGVFTDIKLTNMLDSHWEINLDNDMNEVPKYIKVNLGFKPIHSSIPRKVTRDKPFRSNFILPSDSDNRFL